MSATDATTERTDVEQFPLPETDGDRFQAFLDRLNALEDVHAGYPRDSAEQCGAMGCGVAIHLTTIIIAGFGKRILCPIHALDLVDQEGSRE